MSQFSDKSLTKMIKMRHLLIKISGSMSSASAMQKIPYLAARACSGFERQ
jgi:hypothetical protein